MVNEAFGWSWIAAGFLSGGWIGLYFSRREWLGGYDSYRRRLVRLGHISFVGLGLINILFAHTAGRLRLGPEQLSLASWAFVVGGVTMPLCCGLTAWKPAFKPAFGVPVASLVTGAVLVVAGLVKP